MWQWLPWAIKVADIPVGSSPGFSAGQVTVSNITGGTRPVSVLRSSDGMTLYLMRETPRDSTAHVYRIHSHFRPGGNADAEPHPHANPDPHADPDPDADPDANANAG